MIDSYLTLKAPCEGFYKEKGSKFYAHAFPVKNEEEIKHHQEALRKQYHDARHHCYAYVLSPDASVFRANDDGEPAHSAGDPILGQIRSKALTYVLVVVIRYFGGTKLGVGGLIQAYKSATSAALETGKVIKAHVTEKVKFTFSYEATNEMMQLVDQFQLNILQQDFTAQCTLEAEVIISQKADLFEKVQLLKDTGSEISFEMMTKH